MAGKPADPRRILLMTFTDAAAAELRTRVTQLVLKARYDADRQGDDHAIQRTVEVLRALPAVAHLHHPLLLRELPPRARPRGRPLARLSPCSTRTEAKALLDEVARNELLARLNRPARRARKSGSYDPDFEVVLPERTAGARRRRVRAPPSATPPRSSSRRR